jgi:hypothetical protein
MTVKPESPTTYVLRAQGPGGVDTRSLAVNVSNEEFSIVKFSAKPGKLKPGDSAQLIWLVTGPVTGLSISPGIGDLSEMLGQISVRPQESTTYTLTVHAGTRQLTANAKIKVK